MQRGVTDAQRGTTAPREEPADVDEWDAGEIGAKTGLADVRRLKIEYAHASELSVGQRSRGLSASRNSVLS